MDDIRLDARAYDPAYVNAVMREARQMRNEVVADLIKAVFDGRLTARLFGTRAPATARPAHPGLPDGTLLRG